jgi:uncharacterized protein YbgA (DUF1722 family)/uncharacterized protein YbbK (DUF523 family)
MAEGSPEQALRDQFGKLPPYPQAPLTVAISECLTGGEVRYDGGHKRSSIPHEQLEGLFEYRSICPEVGIGMGVPREPIRLVGLVDAPRAVSVTDSSVDVTDALSGYANDQIAGLGDVDGYIFMKNSPSCGLFRVKVYGKDGVPGSAMGRGIYARKVVEGLPDLPVEESGRLFDAVLRENFVTRTFVHAHWRALKQSGLTGAKLIAFHTRYKYLVMAHSVSGYKSLGRMLADVSGDLDDLAASYINLLMQSLTTPATRGGHANALAHLSGYVKKSLEGTARKEMADLIEQYRRGELPLLAPLTLLKHHLASAGEQYALHQFYLDPHPPRSGLRREL